MPQIVQRLGIAVSLFLVAASARASQLVERRIETKLLPAAVEYNALLPDDYDSLVC